MGKTSHESKTPFQYSLLEMLLGFALLTALCVYLLDTLRPHRTVNDLPSDLWEFGILFLLAGMRWAMPPVNQQQASGWWWICSATLLALANGLYVKIQFRNLDAGLFYAPVFFFFEIIGVLIFFGCADPRPRLIAVTFHLLAMASLLVYNVYLFSQVLASC